MCGTDIRKNGSGYRDDTAFKAICNAMRADRKANRHGACDKSNRAATDCDDGNPLVSRGSIGPDDAGKLGR